MACTLAVELEFTCSNCNERQPIVQSMKLDNDGNFALNRQSVFTPVGWEWDSNDPASSTIYCNECLRSWKKTGGKR